MVVDEFRMTNCVECTTTQTCNSGWKIFSLKKVTWYFFFFEKFAEIFFGCLFLLLFFSHCTFVINYCNKKRKRLCGWKLINVICNRLQYKEKMCYTLVRDRIERVNQEIISEIPVRKRLKGGKKAEKRLGSFCVPT